MFFYRNEQGLIPDLAESCRWQKKFKLLLCKLKPQLFWNDGQTLTTDDFLRGYQKMLDAKSPRLNADWLFTIKNAKKIFQNELSKDRLGIRALNKREIEYEFEIEDPEFEFKLSNTALAPIREGNKNNPYTSGPYQLKEWSAGKKLTLTSNSFYWNKTTRPDVEFYFIAEDNTALKLYQNEQLDFLRRLPTLYIPEYKKSKEFIWHPILRFDYIGFSSELRDQSQLRKALTQSLDFPSLQALFFSDGEFGCPGTPPRFIDKKVLCYKFKEQGLDFSKISGLTFSYSTQGGEDHRRLAEWLQEQWKKNLKLTIAVQGKENKIFLSDLARKPTALFRKGNAPDWPTCAAILEAFTTSHPENYLKFSNVQFDRWISEMRRVQNPKKLCRQSLQLLMDENVLIPTGPMHFAFLAKPQFKNWYINELNQMDLSELQYLPK